MIIWLTLLSGYVGLLKFKLSKSETTVKYLLPFIQDKTLKALTSYIENDSSELSFDENGELLEKETPKLSESLYNEKFTMLPDDCKAASLEVAIDSKLVHKIAKYRFSIDREKITTLPDKVCLFWKPGTIFAEFAGSANKNIQFFVLRKNKNPLFLYSSIDKTREGQETSNSFENFVNNSIELLALPEEYLRE